MELMKIVQEVRKLLVCVILCKSILLVPCPMPFDPMNGMINCLLGDDGALSYEDTCITMCNTGYEIQAGDNTRTCQSNMMLNGTVATCGRGMTCKLYKNYSCAEIRCLRGHNRSKCTELCMILT